jgi:DNA-binding CsgD family transcriptional regulator
VYSAEVRAWIHGALLLSTAILISFCRKARFAKTARIGAVILLSALSAFLFLLPDRLRAYAAPMVGIAMGLINFGILIPFVFVMNNTEKFYAVVISNILLNVFTLISQTGLYSGAEKIVSFVFVLISLIPILMFRTAAFVGDSAQPKPKPQKITYFTLAINFVFAIIVLGFGKLMMDYMPEANSGSSRLWHAIGGLAGCGLYLLVFAFVRKSLNVTWNITFACFFLAILCGAIGRGYVTAVVLTSLFIGLSVTMGMINMFYNVGIIGQKYGNMNHLKLVFWFGVVGGGFCILLDRLAGQDANAPHITALGVAVSSVMVVFYFIISPILARTYFEDGWIDDSEVSEIARIKEAVSAADKLENLGLTPREKEVCALLLKSLSIKQISGELGLAFATVNGYYRSLYRKLGINSKGELFMRFGAEIPEETEFSSEE